MESSLDEHPACAEAAVVGYPHPIKGEGIYAFVTLKESAGQNGSLDLESIRTQMKNQVCVCVFLCMYVYIKVLMHACHVYMDVCVCLLFDACLQNACLCVLFMYVGKCLCVCVHNICSCMCTHSLIHAYICIYIYIYVLFQHTH